MNTDSVELLLLPRPRKLARRKDSLEFDNQPLSLVADPSIPHEQGYRLSITPSGISIISRSEIGSFYAHQTLTQLRLQCGRSLPCIEIEDWPDFPVRGVMIDISRDKVPTMTSLFALVDKLAGWKINQLQLYIEHTFAYVGHRRVWEHASPMTANEIQQLDAYCRDRFIELVPNQNSLGHMERWLKHSEYQHLAEAIDGSDTGWGFKWVGPFSMCPTNPQTMDLLENLYAQLLPNFSSKLFNVGCDETFDIGQGQSKAECDRMGVHRVYLNFIQQVNKLVKSQGRQMMFWGDVIVHQPQLIAELPKDLIALQWGYEADHPFDRDAERFASAGVPFYVCPGTSSWNSFAGRTENAIANLRAAADSGLRHGAIGYLNTDWGDAGHLQYLPASYVGFTAGAAFSWCNESNHDLDFAAIAGFHAFGDQALGQAAYDLGNVYRVCGKSDKNGSALFRLLVPHPAEPKPETGMAAEGFDAAEAAIDAAVRLLDGVDQDDAERTLIVAEIKNSAKMMHLGIHIGRTKLGLPTRNVDRDAIIAEHRRLWLARNRSGGLEDSVRRLRAPIE